MNDTTWEMIRPIASRLGAVIVLLVGLALLTGATETHTPSARTLANPTTTPESSDAAIASPLPAPTASPTPVPGNTSTPEPTPTAVPAIPSQFKASRDQPVHSKRGYSSDHGVLSPYVEPDPIDGAGRKLLAIYMVGSDLEEEDLAGSIDLWELLAGYGALPDGEEVEVIVAFGGARKDGWQGMKLANIEQLWVDVQDRQFGNETGADAYLYQADGAHMGDESSLKLFLDYLRDGYVNFDQRFLTFWDHGGSYLGFGNDTNFNSDSLSLDEIGRAFQNSEPGRFDLIGFDACLMASVEVAKVIEPHAQYMIASQALEPGHGWFWISVIEAFAQEDSIVEAGKRMVDDFVQNPSHADSGMPKTLSLLDLSEYDALISALDPVVSALGDQLLQNEAYSHGLIVGSHRAQTYGVDEREDSRVSIDLMHFAQLMAEQISDTELGASLDELMDAVDRFVIYSNHDGSKPNSFGIAIDAPENASAEYAAYKASDSWLDFQSVYADFLVADLEPPVVVREFSDTDGTFATVYDDNLAKVTTLYGFIQPVEYEDGTVEDFFMVVAEEEVFLTEVEDMYLASTWDQIWFTVEYDPEEPTAWIPAFFSGRFEEDGLEFIVFTAEIDYYQADKDYSGYEVPYDYATMSIIVYDDGESWEIVDHYVETYQFLFSGPDDEEGTVQFDKATYRLGPGDGVQFLNFGFSLEDEANDDWFYTGDGLMFFVQEPVFHFELLEFEDESDELIDYYYAIWAEDASGNWALGELVPSERVVDSPFGSMQVFRDPWNGFEVQVPQPWIEEEPDTSGFGVFRAYDPEGSGGVAIYVEDGIPVSLAEHADALEAAFIEAGVQDLTREAVETIQGLWAVLFEGADDEEGFIWLAYLSDDGLAIDILYSFSIDQFDAGRELAYYSFGTFLVDSPDPVGTPGDVFGRRVPALMEKWGIPGGAVAIVRDGKLVMARGYGLADVEGKEPVHPDSLFRIASISKPVTAAAILKLVQEGHLDLDDRVFQIGEEVADPRINDITVRQLLQHSGGWDFAKSNGFDTLYVFNMGWGDPGVPRPVSPEDIIRVKLSESLDFDPGTQFAYSNFGYYTLGRVIEAVTGLSYEEYVRSEILEPVGITRMSIGDASAESRETGEVRYYGYPGEPLVHSVITGTPSHVPAPYSFDPETMDADGGWIASPIDLVRLVSAIDGSKPPTILNSEIVALMTARPELEHWQDQPEYYGMGWFIYSEGDEVVWWHTGSLFGTASILVRTRDGTSWAALFNSRPEDYEQFFGELHGLLFEAVNEVTRWPSRDLFPQYGYE